MKYLYLLLDIGLLLFPLVFSFHPKIRFYKKWKYLFPAILIMSVIFLGWDYLFTEWGIWSFNDEYITGVKFFGLPLEELLFFICLPYSCLFIYEALITYTVKNYLKRARLLSWLIIAGLAVTLFFNYDYLYTGATFLLTISYLFQLVVIHRAQWLGRFYMGFTASLVPFLIISGVLTAMPVVVYNSMENLGIRIFTIPVENVVYLFLELLLTTALYERFQGRFRRLKEKPAGEIIEETGSQEPEIQQQ